MSYPIIIILFRLNKLSVNLFLLFTKRFAEDEIKKKVIPVEREVRLYEKGTIFETNKLDSNT